MGIIEKVGIIEATMNSTLHFDICGLIILIILLSTLILCKLNKGRTNMLFCVLVAIVLGEDVFGMLGTRLDSIGVVTQFGRVTRYLVDYIHMACIIYVMPLFILYVLSVLGIFYKLERELVLRFLWWGPIAIEIGIMVFNVFTGKVFYYNEEMVFQRGFLLASLYIFSYYYIIFAMCLLIYYRRLISKTKLLLLGIFAPVNFIVLLIQQIFPDLHLDIMSMTILLVVIAIGIQRPDEYLDYITDTQSQNAFLDELNKINISKTPSRIILFKCVNYKSLRSTLGLETYIELVRKTSDMIKAIDEVVKSKTELFYLDDGTFAAIGSYKNDEKILNLGRMISAYTQEPIRINKMEIMLETCVCYLRYPEDITNLEALTRFINDIENRVPNEGRVINLEKYSKLKDFKMLSDIDEIINRGIVNNSYQMYYQPIYSVKEGKFTSAEALIRLIDEEYGFVSPGLFIPASEKSGAIHQIGDFVFDDVCRFMASDEYKALEMEYIEINLSVAQCIEINLVEKFDKITKERGVNPSSINLEITETAMDYDPFITDSNIGRLRKRGYTFSLDDYGTGYSNIKRLVSLPLDIVKIDKSLVDEMDNPQMWTVITNTVKMLNNMKKKILVEGIEDSRAANRFMELGCDYIQGFYYSRPLPEKEFIEFIRRENGIVG